jgi:hypothetical protein
MKPLLLYRQTLRRFSPGVLLAISLAAAEPPTGNVDEAIKDAYKKGYLAGYQKGYADAKGGNTIGGQPPSVTLAPRQGGGTTGRDALLTFKLNPSTSQWHEFEKSLQATKPIAIGDTQKLLSKTGSERGTLLIEDYPLAELSQLQAALKKARSVEMSIGSKTQSPAAPTAPAR